MTNTTCAQYLYNTDEVRRATGNPTRRCANKATHGTNGKAEVCVQHARPSDRKAA